MGFDLDIGIPAITVFVQGLLSFFSPCVLPLIPLYVGYLAGGTARRRDDGTVEYPRGKVLANTLFFVVGVSFAFFLLGFGFTAIGRFFSGNQRVFAVAAGIIMALFGLYMIGAFGKSRVVETEHRLPFNLNRFAMNPLVALALGFTFSFAWTPCVGPVLASVLLMASSSASAATGFALVGVYTLGFVVPFFAVGLATSAVLQFFRTHGNIVQYTVKIGGALLIVMGLMTATGWMNGITGYLSSFGSAPAQEQTAEGTEPDAAGDGGAIGSDADGGNGSGNAGSGTNGAGSDSDGSGAAGSGAGGGSDSGSGANEGDGSSSADPSAIPAPLASLELVDQNGVVHTLADYRGQVIFLNFFATWCGPCQREIPDIEALYRTWGENAGDLVVLGVANPRNGENPSAADVGEAELRQFIADEGITYPVLMDFDGALFAAYGVSAFPTTFMIAADGTVYGYVAGMLTADMMDSIVDQTMGG